METNPRVIDGVIPPPSGHFPLRVPEPSQKPPLKLSLANIFIQTLSLDSPYFSWSYKQSHLGFCPAPGTRPANFSFLERLLVTHSVHFLLPLPEGSLPPPHN